jgi:hypothetical protein
MYWIFPKIYETPKNMSGDEPDPTLRHIMFKWRKLPKKKISDANSTQGILFKGAADSKLGDISMMG